MAFENDRNDWYLTSDLEDFLARAGEFLRARPAGHTVHLTVTETLRSRGPHVYGDADPEFGVLTGREGKEEGEEEGGAEATRVRGTFLHTPPYPLCLTSLTEREADALAARLAGLGRELSGVSADRDTAAAFAEAWRRRTGAGITLRQRQRLYRLGELTVPQPVPPGRARVVGEADRKLLARWFEEFCADSGEVVARDPGEWADERIERGSVLFWETPDGTPVAMAGTTPEVAGQVRVAGVYTPAHLRRRGYAGAVTAAVSRAAREAGAQEVLLFTDLANPTSNGLYQRIGYRPVSDFAVYDFG
ncbi:GNAT family N-acetyltransferase [Streptomyces thermoalcalitolerans]|uniref:GNAT family N-acetyltransferase n=1 Tax=Streptomyces thermoalcalitolerans TaxID=65605 RepID=A0ABN1PS69_9ACTN